MGALLRFMFHIGVTNKARNSTKQVLMTAPANYYEIPCTFADGYDAITPLALINLDAIFSAGLDIEKMMALCGQGYVIDIRYPVRYGHYRGYFIDDISFRDRQCIVAMSADLCGYYKSDIVNSVQYVERSGNIDPSIDQDFPVKWQRSRVKSVAEENIFPLSAFSPGSYVIGVAGVRGICYYSLSEQSFTNLTTLLFAAPQDTLWESLVNAAATTVTKTFLNPMDFLLSATWLPILRVSGEVEEIYLGYWDTGVKGVRVDVGEILYQQSGTIAFPPNPYAEFKPYLQAEQYADYELYVPCCGSVRLQPGLYPGGADAIYYHAEIDYLGNICVGYRYLPSDVSDMDGVVTGYCGSAVPISSSGGMLFLTQKSESSGGQSANFLSARQQNRAYIVGTFSDVKDNSGVPGGLYRGRRLLSVGSWYQVIEPKVDWACLDVERRALEQVMADGIYCE